MVEAHIFYLCGTEENKNKSSDGKQRIEVNSTLFEHNFSLHFEDYTLDSGQGTSRKKEHLSLRVSH